MGVGAARIPGQWGRFPECGPGPCHRARRVTSAGPRYVDLVDVGCVPVAAVEGDGVGARLQGQLDADGVDRVDAVLLHGDVVELQLAAEVEVADLLAAGAGAASGDGGIAAQRVDRR